MDLGQRFGGIFFAPCFDHTTLLLFKNQAQQGQEEFQSSKNDSPNIISIIKVRCGIISKTQQTVGSQKSVIERTSFTTI